MKNSWHHATVSAGILLVTAFILLFPCLVSAQIDTGSVVGIVSDPSGAAIPGATVTLSNEESGVSRSVTTNSDGEYQFAAVIPGTYSVQATGPIRGHHRQRERGRGEAGAARNDGERKAPPPPSSPPSPSFVTTRSVGRRRGRRSSPRGASPLRQ